jgi:proline iminopeptidase
MPFIEHRYGRTYYQSRGSRRAEKIPLICLHGGPGGHSRLMSDFFKLSDKRRVFLYDQIGGGRSSAIKPSLWKASTFVNELKLLIKAWELEEFHLFGASWGTTLALEYYLAVKGKGVRSLTFQSPMFSAADWSRDAAVLIRQLPKRQQKVINYCHEINATDSQVYRDAMKDYYARHVCRNKNRAELASKIKNPNGNQIYEAMWGASEFSATGTLKNYNRVNELRQISCPTLLVCGQYDEARPATARRYTRLIPDARFSEIRGASHAIIAEKPRQLLHTVGTHITQADAQH